MATLPMTISTRSELGETAVGNAARLAEPLGVWSAEANVTGDGSGGVVEHGFMARDGNERRFVYSIDNVSLRTDTTTEIGNCQVFIRHHHELANQTLDQTRFAIVDSLSNGIQRVAQFGQLDRWLTRFPVWWRRDFSQSDPNQEIVSMRAEVNVNLTVYQFRALGRFWDARVLSSRDFWRLFESYPTPGA